MNARQRQREAHRIAAIALEDWVMNAYALNRAYKAIPGAEDCQCGYCKLCEQAENIANRVYDLQQRHERYAEKP